MKQAIVLFSGGIDSTACLYWANDQYDDIILLSFLYGSREDYVIEKTNKIFSSLLGVESKIIYLPFMEEFIKKAESNLAKNSDTLPVFETFDDLEDTKLTKESARSVWVPGRNLLFLSIAASLADSMKKEADIIFGANKEEGLTFPDNTIQFVHRMNSALKLGCMNNVTIIAPFYASKKADIASFLSKKDSNYEYSSSCYNVKNWSEQDYPIHCGKCESCLRRKRAFKQVGLTDKTKYFTNSN